MEPSSSSFAHLYFIATPVFQIRPDGTRATLKHHKYNIFFRIILELVFGPGRNDCKVSLAELMAFEVLAKAFIDQQDAGSGSSVYDGL